MSKKRKQRLSPEELLLAEAGIIRQNVHMDDLPACTPREHQAECVMGVIQHVVQKLLTADVELSVIENCEFYWFLRFSAWNRDVSEPDFDAWTADMNSIRLRLVQTMEKLVSEIDDDGPTLAMRALGDRLDGVKKMLLDKPRELSRHEVETQTDIAMRCFHACYEICREHLFDGLLIENSFFYYWLRASTLRECVAEEFFQKIERHWEEAVRRKNSVMDARAKWGL